MKSFLEAQLPAQIPCVQAFARVPPGRHYKGVWPVHTIPKQNKHSALYRYSSRFRPLWLVMLFSQCIPFSRYFLGLFTWSYARSPFQALCHILTGMRKTLRNTFPAIYINTQDPSPLIWSTKLWRTFFLIYWPLPLKCHTVSQSKVEVRSLYCLWSRTWLPCFSISL